jgi:hypothetical protein
LDVTARLGEVTRRLVAQRELLVDQGISARVAAFASHDRGPDLVKLAVQQGAELILVDGTAALREGGSSVFHEIVDDAPCDVAMLVADETVGHGDAITLAAASTTGQRSGWRLSEPRRTEAVGAGRRGRNHDRRSGCESHACQRGRPAASQRYRRRAGAIGGVRRGCWNWPRAHI